ncbi:hypothetical protein H1230_29635 [Paenibacillus sp. 19GGS1-52]|uniref:hypothetical protein n=1 Tax=Paenibacillus sp. 19GGS1-52 TaxID=2758563 RepID=UPI001EFAEF93|nr:hypothetical protein [Paenibacillus sp. 19GGS1-52]ULO07057.1 hypothetical protein H1230_29635 [Paenibacillus sp. 19GGS1-52]
MERFQVNIGSQYTDQLWGREAGREIRESILNSFLAQTHSVLILDFTEVSRIDFSCASEIVSILIIRLSAELRGRHIILTGLSDLVRENIDAALSKVDKCCLVTNETEWYLIGKCSDSLKDTLSKVIEFEISDTNKIADSLSIAITSCNNRLKTLVDLGMVSRKEVPAPSGGKQFIYYSIL